MTPPAPKASGVSCLARFVSLVFLVLACFVLPQHAAAEHHTVAWGGTTWTISDAAAVDEGGTARFRISPEDEGSVNRQQNASVTYTFGSADGSAELSDLGSNPPTTYEYRGDQSSTYFLEVPIADDDIAEGEETFTVVLDLVPSFPGFADIEATGTINASDGGGSPPPATAPDLTVDDVSVSSASVVEGASFTINATVNNEGDAASAATTLTYYRSADATITTGDTSIATDAVGALAASGSSTQDASVSIATAGTYHVGACVPTVSGETDTDNNCSTGVQVTVTAAVAPQITTQPTDQSVTVGENATFTVAATGTPTPTYQWRFEGSDISGATSASYTLSGAALTNAGDYTVVVTNTAGTVTSNAATLTVTAATPPPATGDVIVSIADARVGEGDGSVTLTASLSRTVSQDVMLGVTYQDGTATFADDLSGTPPRRITIPANNLSVDFTVSINNDTLDEEDETLTVSLGGISLPPGETFVFDGSSHRATLTIIDNDTAVVDARVSIADAQPLSESAGSVNFRVSMTTAVDSDVVLAVAYAGGETNPATPANDLGTRPTTVTIDEGETSATLAVPLANDDIVEGDETFTVTLSEGTTELPDGVTITGSTATGTITDADTATVSLSSTNPSPASEGETITFTVNINNPVAEAFSLGWAASDGTATVDDDLDDQTGTVEIDANAETATFTIPVTRDDAAEDEETFTVALTGAPTGLVNIVPSRVTVNRTSATGTINASNAAPTVNISIAAASATEGTDISFVVTLSTALLEARTLDVTYTAGTGDTGASLGDLGSGRPTTLNLPTGVTTVNLVVPTVDDTDNELAETFMVTLSVPDPPPADRMNTLNITTATATGTILNDDAPVGDVIVSIADARVGEGDGSVTLTARFSRTVSENVTLGITYQDGTATFSDDLSGTPPRTVTIPANRLSADFTVSIRNDTVDEPEEALTVSLGGSNLPPGENFVFDGSSNRATLTIIDNDPPVGTATVSIANESVAENVSGGNAEFTVSVTTTVTSDVVLAVAYAAGTATLATDLGTRPTTVTIDQGQTEATLRVPITNDIIVEGDETFTVTLSEGDTPLPEGVEIGTDATATGTITNDDEAEVSIAPEADTQTEGGSFAFEVRLSAPVDEAVNVTWTATAGTAAVQDPNSDLADGQDITGTATFTAGTTTAVAVPINTLDDPLVEGEEAFTVALTGTLPDGVDYGTRTATATITDNDVAPQITTQPTDQSVTVGENATFTVTATGTPTPTYQWRFDGSDISGATSSSYTISSAALTNAGDYTVVVTNTAGAVTSTAATLTVTPAAVAPQITTQPTDQSVTVGGSATFTVTATGTPTPTYQWRFDGSDISGATSSTYTISSAALTNAGDYTVVVTNTAGAVTSTAATLTVTAAAVAPQITTQPTDQSVTVGGSATFTVTATGTPTPTYQWRFDGSDISGATSSTYTISSAALTNAGDYTVVVTNTAGAVTSTAATLTVTAAAVAPQITTQPTDQSVTVGGSATFTVTATGTPTPTYQWRFDGSDISGATSSTYTISSAALTNAGDYTVVVTNTAGAVTSTAATLTVTAAAVAPQITTQPTDQSVTVGGSATFTVTATGSPTPTYQWRFDGSDISGATSATYTLSNAALTNAGDYTVVVTNTAGTVTSSAATLTVTAAAVAPQITTQPTDQSVTVGENATFTVTATGTPTPTYQWRFEGSDIAGATLATYTLSNAALTNAGDYTVVVTNTAGAVTSTAATLTVTPAAVAPQITTQPTDQSVTVGGSATFTVTATGTPTPTYQWRFDGSDISGATSSTYTISSAALTNAGDYTVVVTNTAGTVTSTAATLTVTAAAVAPQITTQPTDQSVTVGGSATFTVTATGTPTPTYQWRFDGSDIAGATSSTYTISSAALTNAGDYTVVVTNTAGAVTSTAATLTVTAAAVAPQITTQPTDQSVTVGGSATFTVTATGSPTPTYQWRFDGSDISGATSATYTLSNAALTNAGDYTVVVTNTAGTVTSSAATLTVTAAAVAPQITTQPTDQSVTVGENATFTVTATGTPTPTYQWRFEGSDIAGATLATYTLSNAALTNAGDYTVVVTNTAGAVTSTAATLTVTPAAVAPQITTQPTDQSVTVGENATFTVTATGTPTPTYQWRFDGSDIAGATSSSYTISSAALTNAGDYTVVVTNTAGAVTSSAATLTVTAAAVAPQITTQPTDQSVTVGGSATFTVTATGSPTPTYQWRFDGSDIAGATSSSYTISSAALTNAGDYTVVVTNTAGAVTSTAATLTVTPAAVAPQITTQPTDQSVTVGGSATFTVTATGTPTPTYQWRFDGSDIAGATSASYAISSAALTNAGDYTVVVTNTAGAVTSTAATLTVTPAAVAPQITTQPTDQSVTVGGSATFTVTATGSPTPTYQWRFDGSDISGATSSTYTISSAALTNAGDYTVVVTNTAGAVTSTAATLTVTPAAVAPQITTQPTDQSVTVGGSATFTVTATGSPTPTYQWRFDGSDIAGATSSSYTISSAALTNAGDYTVVVTNTAGAVTSTAATLTVTPAAVAPQITTQPTDQSVTVGGSATFTVTATGSPTPTYQWRFDGSDISGATSSTYTISSAALTNAGDYTVVVTNTAGAVTSSAATLTVTAAAVAPQITTQPTDQSVTVGGSATFTVTATGSPTPTYQWRFDGSDIAGATSSSYTISSAALTNAGDYTVVVTNTAGAVTSTAATLTVTAAVTATVSIDDESVVENVSSGTVTFTAALTTAVGSPVVLDVAVTAGTATLGVDLGTDLPTTVTIDQGQTEGTFTVPITDDNIVEGNETFTVTLSEDEDNLLPDGVTISDGAATGTITENDTAEVTLTANTATANENGGTFSYTVNLSAAADEAVVVRWTATDGTAIVADDLQAPRTGTVTFPANASTAQTFTISPANDNEDEDNETFTVTLGADGDNPLPTGVTIGADNSSEATIIDDDDTAELSIAATATAAEGSAVVFEIDLSAAWSSPVTVRWTATATGEGAATLSGPNSDLAAGHALTGTVEFAADDTAAKTVSFATVNDDRVEGVETFTVTLSEDIIGGNPLPDGVSIPEATAAGAGTITEAGAAVLSIGDASAAEGSAVAFAVNLSAASSLPVTVRWTATTTGGEGAATLSGPNSDLTADHALTGTVVFEPDDTAAKTVSFATVNDDRVEGAETFTVTLSADTLNNIPLPAGVSISPTAGAGTGTITEDEPSVLIEPRRIGASTALRRHAGRFDSLTGTVARNRLEARETRRLSGSKDLGDGAVAFGGSFDHSRWGAWIDSAWAGFGGNASGRQADVYGGVDYLGAEGDWLIGALIGYEAADLEIGEATYRADYTHFGIYGGARLSETLLFDGAATYGTATPDIALSGVSASYDAHRITARGALTGDFGLEYGLWAGSVSVEPQLGLLYSRETLGAFTDSAGGVAGREVLQLGRLSAGPRLTWGFDGGRVEGGARMQWDFLQLDDGVGRQISGAADIGVRLDLTPRVTLGVQGDVDGIGVSDEFGSLGGKVELGIRF